MPYVKFFRIVKYNVGQNRLLHFNVEWEGFIFGFIVGRKKTIIDPRGPPTIIVCSDHYFRTCCPYVHTSSLFNITQNKTKSSQNNVHHGWGCRSGRVDHWWHACPVIVYCRTYSSRLNIFSIRIFQSHWIFSHLWRSRKHFWDTRSQLQANPSEWMLFYFCGVCLFKYLWVYLTTC